MIRLKRHFFSLILFLTLIFIAVYYFRLLELKDWSTIRQSSVTESLKFYFKTEEATTTITTTLAENKIQEEILKCKIVESIPAKIITENVFPSLDFEAEWINRREYWNSKFEKRYRERRKLWSQLPLQVFIVPHSHNDPGWLKTFESYFEISTKNILNHAVDKMTKYRNMTFIWTEMSFLHLWWQTAHPSRKENLKRLIREGRFEIPTGGWVMTDEANVHVFAMVDQLIEGHQWLKNTFGVEPKSSWSVDPFGHGKTLPYILKNSGVEGMLIMRIHYAWKEWFAKHQNGDFLWSQSWDQSGSESILCHNFPYDIYSIKGSCGPSADICLGFNYRKVGEYNEYTARYAPINPSNVQERAELLLEQYGKTGSLFPHNVVIVPLGGDFMYDHDVEWDQQFTNYKTMIDFINSHYDQYFTEIRFGTVKDYFDAVKNRMTEFPTLSGDFFVYSDIFSEGRPAYWSGYFTTRPFMKRLGRELEHNLRNAEILFTLAYNYARQTSYDDAIDRFQTLYDSLVQSRRHLGIFQHHDAITGTSKHNVMHDYGLKLFDGIQNSRNIQREAIEYMLTSRISNNVPLIHDDFERNKYKDFPIPVTMKKNETIVVFNSLMTSKDEIVSFVTDSSSSICIWDYTLKRYLEYQVNPMWNSVDGSMDEKSIRVFFLTKLPPLSIRKFLISVNCHHTELKTLVYCTKCQNYTQSNYMTLHPMKDGDINLENSEFKLIVSRDTKFLSVVTHKPSRRTQNLSIVFAKYSTSPFRSGAYLFMPKDPESEAVESFFNLDKNLQEIIIISGRVFSEISVILQSDPDDVDINDEDTSPGTFTHTLRLYHAEPNSDLSKAIYVENDFNLGGPSRNRDIDLVMRLMSDVRNQDETLFTDSNGFQMQKRSKVENIGISGNYFPITTAAFIQDDHSRLTLLVDHAQGVSGWRRGSLEVMVDRRSSYDDARGMGEGVLDSRRTLHKYWILFESKSSSSSSSSSSSNEVEPLLSNLGVSLSRRLNYPMMQYRSTIPSDYALSKLNFIPEGTTLPCEMHLFNLRTLTNPTIASQNRPSDVALMILHRQNGDCFFEQSTKCQRMSLTDRIFTRINVTSLTKTTLTGIKDSKFFNNFQDVLEDVDPMTLYAVKVSF